MIVRLVTLFVILLVTSAAKSDGVIEGTIQNGTRTDGATAGVDVVLRAEVGGQMGVVAETVSDIDGRFRFADLPLGDDIVYLPGANLDDVHFPGSRVHLNQTHPRASVVVTVYEAATAPNPLVIDEHIVTVRSQPGAITVRESLRINNPSLTCYVGLPQHGSSLPVTLQLGVPKGFDRITFDTEAFGRQFRIVNEKLVTSLPWPPGIRELSFTYVINNPDRTGVWRRQLSLPCKHSQVVVELDEIDQARCNLPTQTKLGNNCVRFENSAPLPAGYEVELSLGEVALPIDAHARRVALFMIISLVAVVSSIAAIRSRTVSERMANAKGTDHDLLQR
ncbi:MAG: carboxypeptidase regulatory-like domain-containing protein [Planctomycetales bacterium]|nr:carboxypeptidase regulatory-like domain-containing protein [Planctomycetales bacterium]